MTVTDWGIVTTAKAPADHVLAFVAHHLGLGAAHVWVHLDDADDPVAAALDGIAGVTAVRCDAAYWQAVQGRRPQRHQYRQALNAQRVYAQTGLDWLLHIDVDEFLLADRPVAELLGAAAPGRPIVRVEPWDALHDPGAPDDIYRGRYFRRPLRRAEDPGLLDDLHGPHARLLPRGLLGHSAGKCFFRTGIAGLEPSIHSARLGGKRLDAGPIEPGLALLHFHAEEPERWLARLPFRVEQGAYRTLPQVQAFFREATPEVLSDFYLRTQVATPDALSRLAALGMLREERLDLRAKVAALRDGRAWLPPVRG